MPILEEVPLVDKVEFEANKTKKIKIPKNNFISEIKLRLEVKIVNTAVAPTNHEDNPMSIVKRIRLFAKGKDAIFDAQMSLRFYEQKYLSGTEPERATTSLTASATSTGIAECSIVFRVDENNLDDITALLPAHDLSDLDLEVDWGTNTDLQLTNAGTITAADSFIKVSIVEATLTEEDINKLKEQFGDAKVLNKVVRQAEHDIAGVNDNFVFSKNITIGNLIQRQLLQVWDNGVRNDTLVSRFKFKQYSPVKKDLEDRNFPQSQSTDKRKYRLESVVKGITIIDWSDKGFLDLTDLKDGDVKYEHNNIAKTGTAKIILLSTEFG